MEGFDEIDSYVNTDETGNYIVINTDESSSPIEYRITWYRALSTETVAEEGYYIPDHADHLLSVEEYSVIRELLANHPEIKDWWIKNNILYLEVIDE